MKKLTIIASVAALILPLGALAEHHEERAALSDVWVIKAKPGMEAAFEEAIQADIAFRAKAEDSRTWAGYRAVIGHHYGIYQFRYCCFDWADQDAYDAEADEKGLDANWDETVHPYVAHYHHYLDEMDWKNSHWPEGEDTGPYYGVTSWTWKMGSGPGPGQAREKFSKIALEEGWAEAGNRWLWHDRVGGKPTLMLATTFANFAEMAPPEQSFFDFLSDQMGSAEEAGALFTEFGSGFSSSEYTVWMYDPDLSDVSDD